MKIIHILEQVDNYYPITLFLKFETRLYTQKKKKLKHETNSYE